MRFQFERLVCCQSNNVVRLFLTEMIQTIGNNYVLKVCNQNCVLKIKKSNWILFLNLLTEPFDLSNTARSCCDEKIFERIKKIFYESWHLLSETKDLEKLFDEPLAPPPITFIYDNYAQPPPINIPSMATITSWGIIHIKFIILIDRHDFM